jgi:RNA polymerase sigma-70 factor (ECF subfamily)
LEGPLKEPGGGAGTRPGRARADAGRLRDEEPLLEALRRGEAAAFEKLVRDQTGRLLAVARRMLRAEEDARDAVQDTFLQAFRAVGHFEGKASLSTWLHRICVNACLMKLRTRRRKPETSIDELLPDFHEDGHRRDPGPPWDLALARIESGQTRALVRSCIEELPSSYRTILLLRDVEGLENDEVAKLLGITTGNAKVRLHRARQALRALLDPHFARGDA